MSKKYGRRLLKEKIYWKHVGINTSVIVAQNDRAKFLNIFSSFLHI